MRRGIPSADTQALTAVANDNLLDRVIASSRLDFEEDESSPLDVDRRQLLHTRQANLFSTLHRIKFQGSSPFGLPTLFERRLGVGLYCRRVGQIENVGDYPR